jgi:uncharacterized protein (TIGR02271 family)
MGVPEEHARYYEDEARAGKTLVTVRADGRYEDAQRILRAQGAYDVESRASGLTSGKTDMNRPASSDTLQLREEELVATKRSVETGAVQIGKDVVSEERTLEVPVTREEITIERMPVERRPSDRPMEERSETISVPVHEERVELEKRTVVYEEVGVGKRDVNDVEQVSGTVRREEARIDHQGETHTGSWNQVMPGYRERWQGRQTTASDRWEDAEPAYRYGYEQRGLPNYRGRSWSEVEPALQRDWTERNPSTPWDRAKESVRETWENVTDR